MNTIEMCFEQEQSEARAVALENSVIGKMTVRRIINTHVLHGVLCVTEGILPDLRRVRLLEYASKPEQGFVEILSGSYVSSSYWLLYR